MKSIPAYQIFVDLSDQFNELGDEYINFISNKSNDRGIDIQQYQEEYRLKRRMIQELKEKQMLDFSNAYAIEIVKETNYETAYLEDIKEAVLKDDLNLLELLLTVPMKLKVSNQNINLFVLNYLASFLERETTNRHWEWQAKSIFEQVLDTADNYLPEYIEIADKIFSLNKPSEWYEDFYDQINKLILRMPINEKAFYAIKKGLSISLPEVHEDLVDFIESKYISEGLVDSKFNWIEN
ncbi:hypothetical protein [Foetidibacter luteolus]|uniref:hypothetical protein n=1 Tax=Foetidibacter luteolus TaxID=2608880 RepID=UPI00129B210C|nr:hypothetical protein [Foetidibacter luteolus]